MHVPVLVIEPIVAVLVLMGLRKVQVHAARRENRSDEDLGSHGVVEHRDGDESADERCC